jgi:hypothetical protein
MKGEAIMKTKNFIVSARVMLLVTLVLVTSMTVNPVLASDCTCEPVPCIPPDAVIDSATLFLKVTSANHHEVRLHRITVPWDETTVTGNNFGSSSYDAAVEGSFVADSTGWVSVDVTAIVQEWVYGVYPNFGLLLEQGPTDYYATYNSSEVSCSEHNCIECRPHLEICFTSSSGSTCVILVRPCSSVADASIRVSSDSNRGTSCTLYTGGCEKQTLLRFDFEICEEPKCGCRFTGGGVDTDTNWDHRSLESGEMIRNGAGNVPEGIDRAQFGGQAGANTALPPQPKGEWTHHQQRGPSMKFTFHGGTASAPAGTEIYEIRCSDPGGCKPSGNPPSPAKQLDFDGIGTFKSLGNGNNTPIFEITKPNVKAEGRGNKMFNGTFHWFEVNIDDLGERGGMNTGAPDSDECPGTGFGEKGTVALANCDCPDFYRISIYDGVNAEDVVRLADGSIDPTNLRSMSVIYEFYGYIDGGNLQIHHLTGYDGDTPCPSIQ